MKSGASRDRMSRLRLILALAGAATIALAGVALLAASTLGVAHATPALSGAATPTLDPLIVPTTAASSGSALSNTTISTGSGNIELAITLSCITTIAGLIIAAFTLTALIRTGYGPFLRALLPHRLRRNGRAPAQEPTLRYQPGPHSPETGFELYAESPSPRGARRHAPRDEWADWDNPAPRQSRASQSRRSSSRGSSSRGRSRGY